MDFSSIRRVLASLEKRQPKLADNVLECVAQLSTLLSSSSTNEEEEDNNTNAVLLVSSIQFLLRVQHDSHDDNEAASLPRWEPLAAGLYLATECLQQYVMMTTTTTMRVQQSGNDDTNNNNNNTTNNNNSGVYMEGPRVPTMAATIMHSTLSDDDDNNNKDDDAVSCFCLLPASQATLLAHTLHPTCLQHLEHVEPRVRTLVAKAVPAYLRAAALVAACGYCKEADDEEEKEEADDDDDFATRAARELNDTLLHSIDLHIAAGREELTTTATTSTDGGGGDGSNNSTTYSKSSTGALDDTTGWRALETNWQCLAALMSAVNYFELLSSSMSAEVAVEGVNSYNTNKLYEQLVYSCTIHVNRHVRAAGMVVLEQLVMAAAAGAKDKDKECYKLLTEPSAPLRKTLVTVCQAGLADNWSQVRMAASVLCRRYLMTLKSLGASLDEIYAPLLPRLCLNRFYLAQGVKLYSHETWKLVFMQEGSGLQAVANHLPAMVRYYGKMCDADNHVVREASCQAVAELALRLGGDEHYRGLLIPHVDVLLQSLLMCFFDESWPVRDEAALACGVLAKAFPEACRPHLTVLWERWTMQLTDPIWSVRQDAAVALGDALQAYGRDFLTKILALIQELLPSAKLQPSMSPSEYKAQQNNAELHTDSQLYSCGSLAPKLRKSGAGRIGGCSSCEVSRAKAPWEATDGCIYLIREVFVICAPVDDSPLALPETQLIQLMTDLMDACRVSHFVQANDLRATLWRQLPVMVHALGKDRFKRNYLHLVVDLLLDNVASRTASALSIHAAAQCADELADVVGRGIFRGRLDDYQQQAFDQAMRERESMPKGPPSEGASPFGPPGLLDHVNAMGPSTLGTAMPMNAGVLM